MTSRSDNIFTSILWQIKWCKPDLYWLYIKVITNYHCTKNVKFLTLRTSSENLKLALYRHGVTLSLRDVGHTLLLRFLKDFSSVGIFYCQIVFNKGLTTKLNSYITLLIFYLNYWSHWKLGKKFNEVSQGNQKIWFCLNFCTIKTTRDRSKRLAYLKTIKFPFETYISSFYIV